MTQVIATSSGLSLFFTLLDLPTFWTQLTIEILTSFNFHGKVSLPSFPSFLFTHYISFLQFLFSHPLILVFLRALFSIFISSLYINSSLEISTTFPCLTLMTPRVLSFCSLSQSKFQLLVRYYLIDILLKTNTQLYLKSITFFIPVLLFCVYYLS